jgi:hypothetical protein
MSVNDFWNGFEKRAEDKEPTWWQGQKGAYRAMRRSDKGFGAIIASPELVKERLKETGKGALIGTSLGALGGAGIGALLGHPGIGAGLGGFVGFEGGTLHGANKANKKYLTERGIDSRWGGLSLRFSPEAKAKYIDKYEKK